MSKPIDFAIIPDSLDDLSSGSVLDTEQTMKDLWQSADATADVEHGAISYSVHYYERFQICVPETKVLAVDGIAPDYETIRTKKYPLTSEVYVVTRKGIPTTPRPPGYGAGYCPPTGSVASVKAVTSRSTRPSRPNRRAGRVYQ